MLMDLTCPAEFRTVEVLRDSSGRAQAYLTFLNLSDQLLTELGAMVTMLDAQGVSLGIRPLRYKRLSARPHASFTLCMVMDDLPFFQDARVTIQRVGFAEAPAWHWQEEALMDCTPKTLAPGPQRVALVAVAGPDAVCWPERRRDTWVCVCGRFNEQAWPHCRRCGRDREETFAQYELNRVMAAYQQQRAQAIAAERGAREEAAVQQHATQTRRQRDFLRKWQVVRNRRLAFWLALAAAALILWGLWDLVRMPAPDRSPAIVATPTAIPTAVPADAGGASAGIAFPRAPARHV